MTDDTKQRQDNPLLQHAMASLVANVAKGDREAFAQLFSHYAPRLKGFMMRKGVDADVAEELVQETMLAVWNKARLYSPGKGSVTTWIYTIARNLRIDRLRRQSAEIFYDIDDYDEASDEPSSEEELIRHEQETQVADAIETLPKDQLDVISLAYVDDLSQAEIAERLEVPLGTVKSRMRLAYQKLREALGNRA
ncbi:RNA polymerase sigma-70 factor (ECF subfamily) [Rhodoligotrophos appendicifer]|uniref:sigma-70 family RNA polymerase sigma factor n=1 Tax=Rhodoligotrophos appendicifer TaxID=987056 RepID=UPI001FE96AED|nr:sigma-70 family RNA polymerase sigma factor [Rhodoligotrophos appendicifer]